MIVSAEFGGKQSHEIGPMSVLNCVAFLIKCCCVLLNFDHFESLCYLLLSVEPYLLTCTCDFSFSLPHFIQILCVLIYCGFFSLVHTSCECEANFDITRLFLQGMFFAGVEHGSTVWTIFVCEFVM